ncbi:MAG: sigma 54-interacting transcriptional regulator [Pirellulaceae bacterium]|nr:sigma 54-interacting transcriptional regulator [Pirellulaceae bacterium]
MHAFLVLASGPRKGEHFPLTPDGIHLLGRDRSCQLVLSDPLCSRFHGSLKQTEQNWWYTDEQSLNGSYVNGQKVDSAQLATGHTLRLGNTSFTFELKPLELSAEQDPTTQIKENNVVLPEFVEALSDTTFHTDKRLEDLILLHQLSFRLNGCTDPDEVVNIALDLLKERTNASLAVYSWASDDHLLKPKIILPETTLFQHRLSPSVTKKILKSQEAIWLSTEKNDLINSRYHDAIHLPIVFEKKLLGVFHLFEENKTFSQDDYEFGILLCHNLSVALKRTRQEALQTAQHKRLKDKAADFDEIVGECKEIKTLKDKIVRIGNATGCVLIRGESGSGKELVAQALHHLSPRADRPLLSVNCAAIPADLIDSQLFGHKKGAFTGAIQDHQGFFRQADSGTLFLDEVGEMTLECQSKLLRILEGHPFLPVGSTEEVTVDVRVLAATNRDLREFVKEKKFREDLYYRLRVFELHVPPLRERNSDISLLVDHFFDHFRKQHGRPKLRLSLAAKEKLLTYHWPGNVRQLRNTIDSATVLASDDQILPEDLGIRETEQLQGDSLRIDHWEKNLIQRALSRSGNNNTLAAELLGISRATLYRKIKEYRLAEITL